MSQYTWKLNFNVPCLSSVLFLLLLCHNRDMYNLLGQFRNIKYRYWNISIVARSCTSKYHQHTLAHACTVYTQTFTGTYCSLDNQIANEQKPICIQIVTICALSNDFVCMLQIMQLNWSQFAPSYSRKSTLEIFDSKSHQWQNELHCM